MPLRPSVRDGWGTEVAVVSLTDLKEILDAVGNIGMEVGYEVTALDINPTTLAELAVWPSNHTLYSVMVLATNDIDTAAYVVYWAAAGGTVLGDVLTYPISEVPGWDFAIESGPDSIRIVTVSAANVRWKATIKQLVM